MRPGTLLASRYELRRRHGAGPNGVVWVAFDRTTDREVALKLIPRRRTAGRDGRASMLRDVRASGRVLHPNVAEVYDAGETDEGNVYVVTQLLEGETLATLLARERGLSPPRAARIALEAAKGLAAMHAVGLVHKNLKPSNVLLHRERASGEITVKIGDLGLCLRGQEVLDDDEEPRAETEDGVGYLSPEQVRGEEMLDARSDFWSLGVILLEMLTGRAPFSAESRQAILEDVLRGSIAGLGSLDEQVDRRLVGLVTSCLQRDPLRRPIAAREVVGELERVLGIRGAGELSLPRVSVPDDTTKEAPQRLKAPLRWRRQMLIGMVALVALCVAAAGLWFATRSTSSTLPSAGSGRHSVGVDGGRGPL